MDFKNYTQVKCSIKNDFNRAAELKGKRLKASKDKIKSYKIWSGREAAGEFKWENFERYIELNFLKT